MPMVSRSLARNRRTGSGVVRLEPAEVHFGRSMEQLDGQDSDWDRELRIEGVLRRLKRSSSIATLRQTLALYDKSVVEDAVRRLSQPGLVSTEDSRLVAMLATIQEFSAVHTGTGVVQEVTTPTLRGRLKTKAVKVERNKLYPLPEALAMVKKAEADIDASVNVTIPPNINSKKLDLDFLGTSVAAAGANKRRCIAVFAQGTKAEEARAAGADFVGMDDLAEIIKKEKGDMPFDVVIATPDAMRVVGPLGQILGPRGLMPNPRVGTVTPDIAQAVRDVKEGLVLVGVGNKAIVRGTIFRRSFDTTLDDNKLRALIEALNKAKSLSSKGVYLRKLRVSELEAQILMLGAEGKSKAQFRRILGISARAVNAETESVIGKLQANPRYRS